MTVSPDLWMKTGAPKGKLLHLARWSLFGQAPKIRYKAHEFLLVSLFIGNLNGVLYCLIGFYIVVHLIFDHGLIGLAFFI